MSRRVCPDCLCAWEGPDPDCWCCGTFVPGETWWVASNGAGPNTESLGLELVL